MPLSNPIVEEWKAFSAKCRAPVIRDLLTFAEEDIVLPDGQMEGLLFKAYRQPWAAHWLAACSMPQWIRMALVGCVQAGKTLTGYVIPMTWHLFENQETVVCGIPDMNMGGDKWREDIKPVIVASKYKKLLPESGAGSRDATKVESVTFGNRRTLKFMSGGGKDQRRSAFTTRVVLVTEADGLDEAGMVSREASKLKQIEGRTKAYGDRARIYLECTASIRSGAIWQAWLTGTGSMLAVPCGSCGFHVIPERDSLIGWQEAESAAEARANAAWKCPKCAAVWDESKRKEMNQNAVLVHGISRLWEDSDDTPWEHVPALSDDDLGVYTSLRPEQNFFSMRFNAFNNMFVSAGQLAEAEWLARRAVDTEDADKQIRQQNWAMPAKNTSERAVDLSIEHIVKRQHGLARRVIPDGVSHVTAAMDLGKYRCHWMVIAWTNSYRGYIIDIGVKEVPKGLPEEKALEIAIREQWDEFQEGYAQEKTPDLRRIDRMIVDSGHSGESVYAVARNFPKRIFPYKGYGESSTNKAGAYHEPKANVKNKDVAKGLQYHITIFQADTGPVPLMHVNADYWKGFCHQRLACAESDPSAVTLYRDDDSKHMDLARHLTAEEQVTEIGIGGREVKTWKVKRRENHWLDCYSMNCALAHTNGSRIHLKPV